MRVRWRQGNLRGQEEDVAQATGESAITSGIAELVNIGTGQVETEVVEPVAENAAVRTGKAPPRRKK